MFQKILIGLLMVNEIFALEWQDCSLQADIPSLHVVDYSHSPDPARLDQNHTISKTYLYSGNEPLKSLHELVFIDISPVHPLDETFHSWTPYFNNSFDLCDKDSDKDSPCPIEPHFSFTLSDDHTPSAAPPSWFRAVEYYYDADAIREKAKTKPNFMHP